MFIKSIKFKIFLNLILVLFLIVLSNLGILPVQNFSVFLILVFFLFLLSLFFPETIFGFFVGSVVLENINFAPLNLGINIRLYQLLGGILFLAVLVKFFYQRFWVCRWLTPTFGWRNFKNLFLQIKLEDYLILLFILASFLSAYFSQNQAISFKQSIIVSSFGMLYFLTRIFVQNFTIFKKVISFFLSSSLAITIYGIWQNWRFMQNKSHFEVMAGRPNATLTEPDWLAIFLVFLLAVLYSLIFREFLNKDKSLFSFFKFRNVINRHFHNYFFVFLVYILLILTMARSGWLGAGMVTIIFLILVLLKNYDHFVILKKDDEVMTRNLVFSIKSFFKNLNWKGFLQQVFLLGFLGVLAIILIFSLPLTEFELKNRVQSTGTGKQEITISCVLMFSREQNEFLNSSIKEIKNVEELEKYNCRHINLAEILIEKAKGNLVTKIYRDDPNVNVRAEIYQKSWQEIKKNWLFGVGWGNIGSFLGTDESGTTLNSSNIFLEIWLGAGIVGLLAFVLILARIFWRGISLFFSKKSGEKRFFGLFLILGLVAILIPNLFNAGNFLAYLWVFFGLCLV